jgi:CRISPR-associated protein Cmr6
MRPLYEAAANAKCLDAGNAGLWYDKFCDQWCRDPEKIGLARWSLEAFKDGNPKLDWINALARKAIGCETLLNEAVDRQVDLLGTYKQTPLFFKTDWHFVTGLGREHPIENGFAWHHSLGVPYLPGSSVKGMVRAWVEYWLDSKPKDDVLCRIFGPRGDAARESPASGSVIFLDALPIKPVMVKADIMTPHYGPYYQDPLQHPPADWHSPIPIPFLVVSPGTTFQFGLLPRQPDDKVHIEQASEWLKKALEVIGIGAKTAVGYGRMTEDTIAEDAYQDQQQARETRKEAQQNMGRRGLMTPEQLCVDDLSTLFKDPALRVDSNKKQQVKDRTAQVLKEAGKWPSPADRLIAAVLIEEIYNKLGWGKDPKKQERQAAVARLRQPNSEGDGHE